jgi:hypothetical protein
MGLWADLGFLAKIATGLGMAGKWASLTPVTSKKKRPSFLGFGDFWRLHRREDFGNFLAFPEDSPSDS